MGFAPQVVNLPRGFAYVEFKEREDAEKARIHMDGGQLDGNVLRFHSNSQCLFVSRASPSWIWLTIASCTVG